MQVLAAPLSDTDEAGRYRLEPKDAIKRRLGRSPDKADVVVLGYLGLLWAERNGKARRFF